MTGRVKLTEAQTHAMRTFTRFHVGSGEYEAIDLEAGLSVINARYVELCGPVIGNLYFRITPAGRAAITKGG